MGGGFMRFWKRGDSEFGDELRASRPEPPNELIRAIVARAPKRARHMTRRPLRLAVAGAITTAVVVALAAFGGCGYASSSVAHAVKAVKKVSHVSGHQS